MITTERLVLRSFTEEDAADLYDYLSRPEMFRFEPGEPVSPETAGNIVREWSKGTQFWAAVLREGPGKMVGHVFFSPSGPEHLRTWEIGYMFNPDYQRRGYATEASRALIAHAFRDLGAHRVVAHCSPENPASWKLLEKCGIRREGLEKQNVFFHRDEAGNPIWLDSYGYAILAAEFFSTGGDR